MSLLVVKNKIGKTNTVRYYSCCCHFIDNSKPKLLKERFIEDLQRRRKMILDTVSKEYPFLSTFDILSKIIIDNGYTRRTSVSIWS